MVKTLTFFMFLVTTPLTAETRLPVFDSDFGCLEKATAEGLINEFNIDIESFGGLELCKGDIDSKKLFNDFNLVQNGQFQGNKSNVFIRNAIPRGDYFSWLKNQTRGVRRGHDMPTATAYNSGGYFTMQDGWSKLTTLGRVGTLIHEARHTEGYSHMRCSHGPYKDEFMSGCDSSIEQQGSHGIEMEYYSRVVLQGVNFHPIYAQMARLMNLARANFVFNRDPMSQTEALVAIAQSQGHKGISYFDSTSQAKWIETPREIQGKLKRTSYGVTVFDGSNPWAIDLYSETTDFSQFTDTFSYYKLLTDGRISGVIDAEEVDVSNRRYMVALTPRGLVTYIYGEGRWSAPADARDVLGLVTTAPNGQEGLFIVTKTKDVIPLEPARLRRAQPLSQKWPEEVIDFVNWQNQKLAVDKTGALIDTQSGKAFLPLAGFKIEQIVRAPIYNAF